MDKINWIVRFKNPLFWAQVAVAIIAPILAYFGLTSADMTTWAVVGQTLLNAVSNPYVVVCVIVSVWNAINDPTTKGICDSKRAITYTKPYESK